MFWLLANWILIIWNSSHNKNACLSYYLKPPPPVTTTLLLVQDHYTTADNFMTVRFHYEQLCGVVEEGMIIMDADGDSHFQNGNLLMAEMSAAEKPFYRLCLCPGGRGQSHTVALAVSRSKLTLWALKFWRPTLGGDFPALCAVKKVLRRRF